MHGALCTVHTMKQKKQSASQPQAAETTQNIVVAAAVALTDLLGVTTRNATKLPSPDAEALLIIGQWPGGSIQSLIAAVSVTQSATVRLVDRLEKLGLICRKQATGAHATLLYPTTKGSNLVRKALARRREILNQVLGKFSESENQTLRDCATSVLKDTTNSGGDGDRICRFCCETECPDSTCPVFAKQMDDPAYRARRWK